MTIPSVVFGFLVATLLGAAFHLWRGGGLGRLLLYLILAWIGFWAGHLIGDALGLAFGAVCPLHFGMAVLGALVTLGFGYWLSLIRDDEVR
jgi:hypothetical protein